MSELDVKGIHVDRESEKRRFGQMLQGEAEAHILLIQADSGLGKSSLLREFREMSHAFPTIVTDLMPRHTSEGILFNFCFRLGPANFTRFHGVCQQILGVAHEQGALPGMQRMELRRILSEQFNMDELAVICFNLNISFEEIRGDTPSIKATELILRAERTGRLGELLEQVRQYRPLNLGDVEIGSSEIELTQLLSTRVESKLAGMDRDQHVIYRRLLTAAFFDDLRQLFARQQQRFVFMFDAFNEEINTDVKEWVSDFLEGARWNPWLVVVVAGQRFPTLSFDDREACYRHVLLPFEPQDWHEFARQADVPLEPKEMDLIYSGTNGVPLLLATLLDNLRKRRAGQ